MGRVQEVILRVTAVLAAVTAPLALVACGSSDSADARAVPTGFQPVKTSDFSAAVPDGWQIVKRDGFVEVRPPGTDANRGQLRVGSKREYGGDINAASLVLSGEISVRRSGAQKTASKAIEVPGAADARRIEFTVPAGGSLAAARIVTVLALSEGRTLVNLNIGLAADDPAASQIDEIVRSLEVKS